MFRTVKVDPLFTDMFWHQLSYFKWNIFCIMLQFRNILTNHLLFCYFYIIRLCTNNGVFIETSSYFLEEDTEGKHLTSSITEFLEFATTLVQMYKMYTDNDKFKTLRNIGINYSWNNIITKLKVLTLISFDFFLSLRGSLTGVGKVTCS